MASLGFRIPLSPWVPRLTTAAVILAVASSGCDAPPQPTIKRSIFSEPGRHFFEFDPKTAYARIELLGAGGAGGGAQSGSDAVAAAGSGGGAGAYVVEFMSQIPPTAELRVPGPTLGTTEHGADGAAAYFLSDVQSFEAGGGSGGGMARTPNALDAIMNGRGGHANGAFGAGEPGGVAIVSGSGTFALSGGGASSRYGNGHEGWRVSRAGLKSDGRNGEGYGSGGDGGASIGAGAARGGDGAPGLAIVIEFIPGGGADGFPEALAQLTSEGEKSPVDP